MEEFPPNSRRAQESREAPKRVERVTSAEPVRRKKSLWKQFRSMIFSGDGKTAVNYVVTEVLFPAAKDALVEAGHSGLEKLIYGESRSGRRRGGPPAGGTGYVSYNQVSSDRPPMPRRSVSRPARARGDFDEIVLSSRSEAEEVIDQLYDVLSRYEAVTVADLYELTGIESTHTDHKWGWTDLHGASVARVRSGYLLNLPDPESL